MRAVVAALAVATFAPAASAQSGVYYAERGIWTVATTGSGSCMAFNRPPEEVNLAPYNALQVTVKANFDIGAAVFFWPGAVMHDREYELILTFDRVNTVKLTAPAMGDFAIVSAPAKNPDLWKFLQTGKAVHAAVVGEEFLSTYFVLNDSAWLGDTLRSCLSYLE